MKRSDESPRIVGAERAPSPDSGKRGTAVAGGARPSISPFAGMAAMQRAYASELRARKREWDADLAVIDAWLRDCPPLPAARPPVVHERGGRRHG